jgi:hydroxymethylbilane synthase
MKTLRIVSRKSALALWQAASVKNQLQAIYPDLEITIFGTETEGDQNLNSSLAKIGGKGLFVKALEEYLLNDQADIAVHSLKDVPALLPEGLELATILKREDPRDAFVSVHFSSLDHLPIHAEIGTSSLRRQSQLYALREDLQPTLLRGNIDTRIQKLIKGHYHGILLAVAGLKRLGLEHYIQQIFPLEKMLPAVGQGALCIECRANDMFTKDLIMPLHHLPTALCVLAERTLNQRLGGSCQLPIAGLAEIDKEGVLKLQGMVASSNGQHILKTTVKGVPENALNIGNQVADQLLAAGAKTIIEECLQAAKDKG